MEKKVAAQNLLIKLHVHLIIGVNKLIKSLLIKNNTIDQSRKYYKAKDYQIISSSGDKNTWLESTENVATVNYEKNKLSQKYDTFSAI